MKSFFITLGKLLLIVMVCSGLLTACNNDDGKKGAISGAISTPDPSYGFLVNATPYRLQIDFGEKETFDLILSPGQILGVHLDTKRAYVMHVVVLNTAGRVVSDYMNGFYVDEIPLDNQLRDFVCSWYVEFTANYPEYGYANDFGT